MQAKLIPLNNGAKPIVLDKDVVIVGRKRGLCDVFLDCHSVSKLHCMVIKTDGLLFIRDLASTNGTKVNGQRVIRGALLPGDELAFANARFRVDFGPDEERVSSPSALAEVTEVMTSLPENFPPSDSAELFSDANSDSDVRLLPDDSSAS